MKEEQTYKVEQKGDEVVYTQTMVRTMTMTEALQQNGAFKAELQAIRQQKAQLERQIEAKVQEHQLTNINENMTKLEQVDKDWDCLVKPEIDKVTADLKTAVKVEKAKAGASRVTDPNAKIVLQNKILATICVDKGLDMAHPAVRQVKKDWDTL